MASSQEHTTLPLPAFETPPRVAIISSPYYSDIADGLLSGAKAALAQVKAEVTVIDVPGALEIPTAIVLADKSDRFDAYVALGCVIRGETTHYDIVAGESSRAIQTLGMGGFCIGNGILTVENMDQAEARANPEKMNKGGGAAEAALHLLSLSQKYHRRAPKGTGFQLASNETSKDIA
jgi:6,7-dimethyl-8-ribityllumazine synthase